jgi:hypothetical protein
MDSRLTQLLRMQGFCVSNDMEAKLLSGRARWTSLSCAAFGAFGLGLGTGALSTGIALCPCVVASAAGLWLGSGWFFIALGILTFTGGVSVRSIYDRLYNAVIRHIVRRAPIPEHGPPRRFGCAFGGFMYVLSGIGFFLNSFWMAFVPAAMMIVLAATARITHWCFASALYSVLFERKEHTTA